MLFRSGVLTKKISMEELRPLLNAEVAPYISKLSTRKIHKIINGFGEAEMCIRDRPGTLPQVLRSAFWFRLPYNLFL